MTAPVSPLKKTLLIFMLLSVMTGRGSSQMPEWRFFKDRDGNKYYLDKNGKIWTSGKPEFKYKAVSLEGIDYYLRQGIELIDSSYLPEGLTLLKSILALPPYNNRIINAQRKAVKKISYLQKINGIRYKKLDESASIIIFRVGEYIKLINDRMFYSLVVPGSIEIIKKRIREKHHYIYYGVTIGIVMGNNIKNEKSSGYDILVAIDSEKFRSSIKGIDGYEKKWMSYLFENVYKKRVISKDDEKILYEFETRGKPGYAGFEALYRNGNFGYFVRAITSNSKFTRLRFKIRKIIESFKFVSLEN